MTALTLVLFWTLLVIGAEARLPFGATSWFDVVGVTLVAMWASGLAMAVHDRTVTIPDWLEALGSRLWHSVARYHVKMGVDLRGVPDYPVRMPRLVSLLAVGIVAAAALTGFAGAFLPTGLRLALRPVSATAYLTVTAAMWMWALLLGFASAAVFWVHLNDHAINEPHGYDSPDTRVVLAVLIGVLTGTALLPIWLPAAILVAIFVAGIIATLLDRQEQIRLLWRAEGSPEISAIGSSWVIAWGTLLWSGLAFTTTAMMTRSAWTDPSQVGPTVLLGVFCGWCCVLGAAAWLWTAPIRLLRLAPHDPARPRPTAVQFVGDQPDESVLGILASRGLQVVDEADEARHRVRIALEPDTKRRHLETRRPDTSPLVWSVHPADLTHPDVLSELRAIDRFSRRRELIDGIGKLLAIARHRQFKEGTGFWFAPHLWYISAMSRDTNEEDALTVGPPYHRFLSPEVRHHCHQTFRAVAVDLLFIEDGVPLTGVERVLIQLFDHYDLWGVEPIEDRHFHNVPGIRVMVHDFVMEEPLDEEGYPEPDYEEIGRARVLHILKDRGGSGDEAEDTPDPAEKPIAVGTG